MSPPVSSSDHDLLVEAVTNIRTLLDRSSDQETRIRALERRVYSASAVATLLGGAIGAFLPQLIGAASHG